MSHHTAINYTQRDMMISKTNTSNYNGYSYIEHVKQVHIQIQKYPAVTDV